MAKAWTGKEDKNCAITYSEQGMDAAIKLTGRTRVAVKSRMVAAGIKCAHRSISGLTPIKRSVYAEDVAKMLELECSGISHSLIGEQFDKSRQNINLIIRTAKKNGFYSYPIKGSIHE